MQDDKENDLTGQMLIAMPTMADPRFARTLVYLCAHNSDGAMGIVVNRAVEEISFAEMLEQLEISQLTPPEDILVQYGGPVETQRGFVSSPSSTRARGRMSSRRSRSGWSRTHSVSPS